MFHFSVYEQRTPFVFGVSYDTCVFNRFRPRKARLRCPDRFFKPVYQTFQKFGPRQGRRRQAFLIRKGNMMNEAASRRVPAGFFIRFLLDRPRALSVGLMLAVLPAGVLILLSWLITSMDGKGPDFDALLTHGTPVTATVVDVQPVTRITIEHRNPVRITYRYQGEGIPITDVVQTMAEAGYGLKPGQDVTALVADGDSILPDYPPVIFPQWAIAVIGGLFLMMGLPFLLFAWAGAVARRRLYLRGTPIEGTVDSLSPAHCVPFTATRMQVAFTGTTEEGRAVKGSSVVVVDESWHGKRRGSAIRVLVDPLAPDRACVAEDAVMAQCAPSGKNKSVPPAAR